MFPLLVVATIGLVLLVISTDQFVTGASTVASNLRVSPILVGAVILGCGTGLPELALSFHGSRMSPWRQLFHLGGEGGHGIGLAIFITVLVVVISMPVLFPYRIPRHSPLILVATILFASLLRGSLDVYEGAAMLTGFAVGVALIVHNDRQPDYNPFAPVIDDDYDNHGAYIEAPVMTPVQVGFTRSMLGLVGTAIGAQSLALSMEQIMKSAGFGVAAYNLVFVALGSVLPHVVVAVQALKHHDKGLAVGNLIGSNLFHSLAIGGLVAVVRPYVPGGTFGVKSLVIIASTAIVTWMLLHTEEELSRKQGVALLSAYVVLVVATVP